MSRARVCFLEGLPTITSIVEGFGGVPSESMLQLLQQELLCNVLAAENSQCTHSTSLTCSDH